MKNLKKIVFGLLAMLVMVTSVNAATVDELVTAEKLTKTEDGVYQLTGDLTADIVVNAEETVTLDLAGYKLTSATATNSAIHVYENGALTIIGDGEIAYRNDAAANTSSFAPIIKNDGTLVLDAVKITVDKGGVGQPATGVLNTGKLTVNGGTYNANSTHGWAFTNGESGTIDIYGGTFYQSQKDSIIISNYVVNIYGGHFESKNATDASSMFTNDETSTRTPKLTIQNVEGKEIPSFIVGKNGSASDGIYRLIHNKTNGEVVITGGNFLGIKQSKADREIKEALAKYTSDKYELLEDGTLVTDADFTALNEAIENAETIKAEKDYATKYTEESRNALETVLTKATAAKEAGYKSNKQAEIDSLAEELNNAIAALKTQHKVKLELSKDEVGDAHSVIPTELSLETGKEYRLSQVLKINTLSLEKYKDYTAYYTVSYGDTVEHYTSKIGLQVQVGPVPVLLNSLINTKYSDTFVMPDEEITITIEIKKTEVVEEVTTYTIEVVAPENGELTVDKTKAEEGDIVIVTVKAAEGYKVAKVLVNGEEIKADEDGAYAFEMPAENVTVSAEFEKIQPSNPENNGNENETGKGDENNNNTGSINENQNTTDNKTDESIDKNSPTLDSIVSIVTLAISSLGTAGYSIKKFIRK